MTGYYQKNLAGERLRRAYELAPPRVRQYFEAEIAHVIDSLQATDTVLELGCGFGRVLSRLAPHTSAIIGVDTSQASLQAAGEYCEGMSNVRLLRMNAEELGFADGSFDKVICIQNGISAFHLDPAGWVKESVRVTKPGGLVLISTYSEKFWNHRLEWFRLQSDNGLLGEIDWEATKNGALVCKDGFSATTYTADLFASLMSRLGFSYSLAEVDESSLFCEIRA
jgi:ubiquinone/menaquinone biosynthesis C-methylase UbiE